MGIGPIRRATGDTVLLSTVIRVGVINWSINKYLGGGCNEEERRVMRQ